jgi:hypothetical protein
MRAVRAIPLLLVALLAWTPQASGQEEGPALPSGPPPPVSFLDSRPMTAKLATLREKGGLRVLVHNDSGREQASAKVRVVGLSDLEDPGARGILSAEPTAVDFGSEGVGIATIPIGVARKPSLTEGSYSLQLVASGDSGPVARRELVVTVGAAPPLSERGAELARDSAQDVTIVAVNYLPSLLSGLSWFLISVGLLGGGIVIFVFRGSLSEGRVSTVAMGAAILFAIGVLLGGFDGDLSSGESVEAIASRPIPVSADSKAGTVGTPSSETGELAQLVVGEGKMRAENLRHAGAYKGPYDLAPDLEGKGKGTATINVRDWWPYALLTLALGVSIGYLLRRWYQRERPKAKLELRKQRIVNRIAAENDDFRRSSHGKPYSDLSIDQRIAARFREIDRLIEEGSEKAGETVTSLESYLAKFSVLRESVRTLDVANTRLEKQIEEQDFGYRGNRVALVDEADFALTLKIDSCEADADGATIKAAQEAVSKAHGLLGRALLVHAAVAANLRLAQEACEQGTSDDQKSKIGELVRSFEDLGKELLASSTLAAVETIATTNSKKLIELERIEGVGATEYRLLGSSAVDTSYVAFAADRGLDLIELETKAEPPVPLTNPAIEIGYEVLGVPEGSKGIVHREDEVRVNVRVSSGENLDFTGISIDFGDGSPAEQRTLELAPGPVEAAASRWMAVDGERSIVIRKAPSGVEIGTIPIIVEPTPRLAVHEMDLKRREQLMGRIAAVLAVGSGLATLYLADATWGEPVDYLTALLWGGITAEGVKLASALADRTWPAS